MSYVPTGAVSRGIHYVAARNDRDGNPRRGWHVDYRNDRGRVVLSVFVDEGREGADAFRRAFPHFNLSTDPTTAYPLERITAAEYRDAVRHVITDRAPLVPVEARCAACVAGRPKTMQWSTNSGATVQHEH